MDSADCIDQIGIVEEVREKSILVRFQSPPACGSCQAKFFCAPGSSDKNLIEISQKTRGYSKGDSVKILISRSMGFRALFLGYLFPFLMVILVLATTQILGLNELASGLISLSVLFPYYLMLYLFREKVNKNFIFTIMKVN
jgi:sigma-E factor negative regulatory protein RseC